MTAWLRTLVALGVSRALGERWTVEAAGRRNLRDEPGWTALAGVVFGRSAPGP